jgi:hypothetical protein
MRARPLKQGAYCVVLTEPVQDLVVCPCPATDLLYRRPQGCWSHEGGEYCDAWGKASL